MSSPPPAIGVEDFAFQSSPHSNSFTYHDEPSHVSSPPGGTSASKNPPPTFDVFHEPHRAYAESSGSAASDDHNDFDNEEEMARLNGTATTSSRSSISSLPASVSASAIVPPPDAITPTKSPPSHSRVTSPTDGIKSPSRRVERASPFRHPSSVRAMQMMDEEDLTPPHRKLLRHDRTSGFSARSSVGSQSPSKHTTRNFRSSPQKPKVKKEYPLVLLHCSLLPPSVPLNLDLSLPSHRDLLQEVLPEEYWRRWKLLFDKVGGQGVVRERGILIPHPRNEYDLLEERLLESLELAQGSIRAGHFLGGEDTEDGDEEGMDELVDVAEGQKCPDCGKNIVKDLDADRKWEVKVYAANGLMRAGAWAAAWAEMERVDVEVSVWLPETVRRDAEARLQAAGIAETMDEIREIEEEKRRREVYGADAAPPQERVDGLDEPHEEHAFHPGSTQSDPQIFPEANLQTMLVNYLKLLAKDRRNITIVLLSFLIVVISISRPLSPNPSPSVAAEIAPMPSVPVSQCSPIMVSSAQKVALETSQVAEEPTAILAQPSPSMEVDDLEHLEL